MRPIAALWSSSSHGVNGHPALVVRAARAMAMADTIGFPDVGVLERAGRIHQAGARQSDSSATCAIGPVQQHRLCRLTGGDGLGIRHPEGRIDIRRFRERHLGQIARDPLRKIGQWVIDRVELQLVFCDGHSRRTEGQQDHDTDAAGRWDRQFS